VGLKLQQGRPADAASRSAAERRVYDLLDGLGIDYGRVDHPPVMTMDACDQIDEALAPAAIVKNLFLRDDAGGSLYLLMLRGDKKLRSKEVARQIGCGHLSFASPELMERYLGISPGSVTVMGLMNDVDDDVQLLVDGDLLAEAYIGCHPCVNTSSLRLRTEDVFGPFLKAVHHAYVPVHVKPAS
jgi:Ala-tRNA(Pro) deacylase